MKVFGQICILLLAAGVTLAAGIYQGQLAKRSTSQQMQSALPVIQSLPADIGPWHLEEPTKLPAEVIQTLQCAGYVDGRYVNRETGDTVFVGTLLGPPGPMSVHRPEICYSAINFPQATDRERVTIESEGVEHSAWMVQFDDQRNEGQRLKVYYSWSNGGPWTASDEPRVAFGTSPYLFKVQILVRQLASTTPNATDPGKSFLQAFIPVVKGLMKQHSIRADGTHTADEN